MYLLWLELSVIMITNLSLSWGEERDQQDATDLMFIIKLLSHAAASQLHTTTAITTSAEHHMRQCTLFFS